MKNTYFKLLLILISISLFNCTDLEEEPVGILAPEGFYKSPEDVQATIFGAYGLMAAETMFGRKYSLSIQLRGDLADIGNRGTPARRQQVNDFDMDANNGMTTVFWPEMYKTVSAVNSAISGVDQIEAEEGVKKALEGEARFIRAFIYYHLVRSFGEVPYLDFPVSDPESVKSISKTSVDDLYGYIIEDLEFAKLHLPETQPENVRSRATKGTAASYLASVHLTLGNWPQAAAEAKYVINNKDLFGYNLEADYQDIFRAENADALKETIFSSDFIGQIGAYPANVDYMGALTGITGGDMQGWSVSVPAFSVYETWDDRDYRKIVSFDDSTAFNGVQIPYTEFATVQRPHIAKWTRYPGLAVGSVADTDHNYILMRYAEVLFIAAEAIAEENGGPNAESIGYLNEIRARARNWGGTQVDFPADLKISDFTGKEDFIDAVLEDRKWELSFEFKRWFDIKRRNLGDKVFKGPDSLEPHENFDASRDYLFPLPGDELDRNTNLKPQNPGY
ncbi:RagB/SusD family nutrient uptake outer membrane protein [Flexithrix dorotheae]|uniref:RagB/SusD family nutrient uptake outer membrane protein n=1 Tax=Flexithrix dorotheae TaxID=70993 RepID=UPI00037EC119|nr:RagB/SusD family nutrient uptake outer membrane protein [Flexithrix dorotheae]